MNEQKRLTPMGRWRERLIRLTNNTKWGKRAYYWFGKTIGGLQLRLEKLRPDSEIPWTPLRRPIAQATVALIANGGGSSLPRCTVRPESSGFVSCHPARGKQHRPLHYPWSLRQSGCFARPQPGLSA